MTFNFSNENFFVHEWKDNGEKIHSFQASENCANDRFVRAVLKLHNPNVVRVKIFLI